MSLDITATHNHTAAPAVIDDQLYCALTGVSVTADQAYWAPPFITARQLITTLWHTLTHTPNDLAHILFDEQPNVPYAPEAREQLASRRSSEQLKLLVGLLALMALLATPVILSMMR